MGNQSGAAKSAKEAALAYAELKKVFTELNTLSAQGARLNEESNSRELQSIRQRAQELHKMGESINEHIKLNDRELLQIAELVAKGKARADQIKAHVADQKAATEAAKRQVEQYQQLLNLQKQINSYELQAAKLDPSKDANAIVALHAQADALRAEYEQRSRNITLTETQRNALEQLNRTYEQEAALIRAKKADTTATQNEIANQRRLNELYKQRLEYFKKMSSADAVGHSESSSEEKRSAALEQASHYAQQLRSVEAEINALVDAGADNTQLEADYIRKSGDYAADLKGKFADTNSEMTVTTTLADKILTSLVQIGVHAAKNLLRNMWQEATKYANEYYDQMNEIRVVTGMNQQAADELAVKYRDMAREMNVSSKEIAEAAITFYRQGLSDDEVDDRLKWVTEFAKVTDMSFDEASELLTATLNGYSGWVDQATGQVGLSIEHVTDTFIAMGNAAATSGAEMATAMQKVASVASDAGVSFEQLSSWIATLSERTRLAPESIGTALNTILARMRQIKQTGFNSEDETKLNDVTKALATQGIALMDAEGNWRSMGAVFEEIGSKWAYMDDKTRSYLATVMAGTRGQNFFIGLMEDLSKTAEGVDGVSRALTLYQIAMESANTTTESFAVWQESVTAAQGRLQASLEKLYGAFHIPEITKGLLDLATNFLDVTSAVGGLNIALPVLIGLVGSLVTFLNAHKSFSLFDTIINFATGHPYAMIAAGVGAMIALFSSLIGMVGGAETEIADRSKDIDQSLSDIKNSINDAREEQEKFAQKNDAIVALRDEYEELAKKTDKTAEDQQKLNALYAALEELVPGITSGVQNIGDKYSYQKDMVDKLNESLAENMRLQKEASKRSAYETLNTIDATASKIRQQEDQIPTAHGRYYTDMNQFVDNYAAALQEAYGEDIIERFRRGTDIDAFSKIFKEYDLWTSGNMAMNYGGTFDQWIKDNAHHEAIGNQDYWNNSNISYAQEEYMQTVSDLADLERQKEDLKGQVRDIFSNFLDLDNVPQWLAEGYKQQYQSVIDGFDYTLDSGLKARSRQAIDAITQISQNAQNAYADAGYLQRERWQMVDDAYKKATAEGATQADVDEYNRIAQDYSEIYGIAVAKVADIVDKAVQDGEGAINGANPDEEASPAKSLAARAKSGDILKGYSDIFDNRDTIGGNQNIIELYPLMEGQKADFATLVKAWEAYKNIKEDALSGSELEEAYKTLSTVTGLDADNLKNNLEPALDVLVAKYNQTVDSVEALNDAFTASEDYDQNSLVAEFIDDMNDLLDNAEFYTIAEKHNAELQDQTSEILSYLNVFTDKFAVDTEDVEDAWRIMNEALQDRSGAEALIRAFGSMDEETLKTFKSMTGITDDWIKGLEVSFKHGEVNFDEFIKQMNEYRLELYGKMGSDNKSLAEAFTLSLDPKKEVEYTAAFEKIRQDYNKIIEAAKAYQELTAPDHLANKEADEARYKTIADALGLDKEYVEQHLDEVFGLIGLKVDGAKEKLTEFSEIVNSIAPDSATLGDLQVLIDQFEELAGISFGDAVKTQSQNYGNLNNLSTLMTATANNTTGKANIDFFGEFAESLGSREGVAAVLEVYDSFEKEQQKTFLSATGLTEDFIRKLQVLWVQGATDFSTAIADVNNAEAEALNDAGEFVDELYALFEHRNDEIGSFMPLQMDAEAGAAKLERLYEAWKLISESQGDGIASAKELQEAQKLLASEFKIDTEDVGSNLDTIYTLLQERLDAWVTSLDTLREYLGEDHPLVQWLTQLQETVENFDFSTVTTQMSQGVEDATKRMGSALQTINQQWTNSGRVAINSYQQIIDAMKSPEEARGLIKAYDELDEATQKSLKSAGVITEDFIENLRKALQNGETDLSGFVKSIAQMDMDKLGANGQIIKQYAAAFSAAGEDQGTFTEAMAKAVDQADKLKQAYEALAYVTSHAGEESKEMTSALSTLSSVTGMSAASVQNNLDTALEVLRGKSEQTRVSIQVLTQALVNMAGKRFDPSSFTSGFVKMAQGANATELAIANLINKLLSLSGMSIGVDTSGMVTVNGGGSGGGATSSLTGLAVKAASATGSKKNNTNASATSTTGKRGGGGGGSTKKTAEEIAAEEAQKAEEQASKAQKYFLQSIENELDAIQDLLDRLGIIEESWADEGYLTGVINTLTEENKWLAKESEIYQSNMDQLRSKIDETKAELASTDANSDIYDSVASRLSELEKKYAEYNKAILQNTAQIKANEKAIKEYRKQIWQMESDLRDTINAAIEDRKAREKEAFEASREVEEKILEVVMKRYEKERDEILETTNTRIKALNKESSELTNQLNKRKQLAEQEDKAMRLSNLQAQYARISADPTRAKDAQKIAKEIAELQEEMAWDAAEQEVEAQQEAITEKVESLEDYASYIESYYEELLKDPRNFEAEVNNIMKMSMTEILEWLKANDEEYIKATANMQKEYTDSWTETLEKMFGIIKTNWAEVEEIISKGGDYIVQFLQENSQEFLEANSYAQKLMTQGWMDAIDNLSRAYLDMFPTEQLMEFTNTALQALSQVQSAAASASAAAASAASGSGGGGGGGSGGNKQPTTSQVPIRSGTIDHLGQGSDLFMLADSNGQYYVVDDQYWYYGPASQTDCVNWRNKNLPGGGVVSADYVRAYNIQKKPQDRVAKSNKSNQNTQSVSNYSGGNSLLNALKQTVERASAVSSIGSAASLATRATENAGQRQTYRAYASGGLIDRTGYAWLDGTKTNPESINDAELTRLLINADRTNSLKALNDMLDTIGMMHFQLPSFGGLAGTNTTANTINVGDIIVQVDTLNDDADFEEVATRVKDSIVADMSRGMSVGGIRFN